MAITLPDARELSDEVLEALRMRALHAREAGFKEGEIAEMLGVARETVSRWWSAYSSQGMEGLPGQRTGRPEGAGRLLSEEQAAQAQRLIDEHRPEELGIPAPLWNRAAVRELIRKEFGMTLAVRTVGQYLHRWGYTCKRPRRHARQQDPEEVREWLEKTYPAIERRARAEGAEIFWCDETGVAADQHPGYGYAREGQPATMEVPDRHIRMNMISAISNEGAVRFMTYAQAMNAALFITFLQRLLRGPPGKLFVIADHLPAHDRKAVHDWVAEHKERIELFYLPRRSPEMNPDEYLNNDLKGNIHQEGLPDNKDHLRSRIQRWMHRLANLPEHIMNYFREPHVTYASANL